MELANVNPLYLMDSSFWFDTINLKYNNSPLHISSVVKL